MARICQDEWGVVRPTEYFPETFIWGTCDVCQCDTFVARVGAAEVAEAKAARGAYESYQRALDEEEVSKYRARFIDVPTIDDMALDAENRHPQGYR